MRVCRPLVFLGTALVEGSLATLLGDIVLVGGSIGVLIVLVVMVWCIMTSKQTMACRKWSSVIYDKMWITFFYVAIQGGRVYGAGRGCPLSFDRGSNLNGADLRKICNAEYRSLYSKSLLEKAECTEPPSWADMWDTPSSDGTWGSKDRTWGISGCACAFVPGCIGGFILLCCLWPRLFSRLSTGNHPSVRQDLESKLRENQQLQTAAQIRPTPHSAPVDVESPAEHEAEEGAPPM